MSQWKPVPISLSKVSVWMPPRLKTVSAEICRFIWTTTFWVFVSWNIRNENKRVNKNHFPSCMSYPSLNKGSLSCPQYLFVKHKIRFQTDDALFQTCVCSNALILSKKPQAFSIFEPFYSIVGFHCEYLRTQKLGNFVFYIKQYVWADTVLKSGCGHSEILRSVIEIDVA